MAYLSFIALFILAVSKVRAQVTCNCATTGFGLYPINGMPQTVPTYSCTCPAPGVGKCTNGDAVNYNTGNGSTCTPDPCGTCMSPSPPPSPSSGGKGEPHFHGADSSHYDFSGVPNTTYCLFSDKHITVNAYFGGRYDGNKVLTWMRNIGIVWGDHSVILNAREGSDASYDHGYMNNIIIDGKLIELSKAPSKFAFAEGAYVSWLFANASRTYGSIDVYSVEITDVISLIMELRPDYSKWRTLTDGTVHFDIEIPYAHVSEDVHGIIGQTYRKDKGSSGLKRILGANGEGYLDGTIYDYNVSSITAFDCKINRFEKTINNNVMPQ